MHVDGAAFVPTTCKSGQARGFAGVELEESAGGRLRLAQALDGTFQVVYFPPGAPVGENLGSCGTLTLQNGIAVVNGVRNVEGNAKLSCDSGRYKITGNVVFDGCH